PFSGNSMNCPRYWSIFGRFRQRKFLYRSPARCANFPQNRSKLSEKMSQSLFEKVWNAHAVRELSNGQTQLLIGTHLIHEVTSPQAFGMLRDLGLKVKYPHRTFATVDHIVPTRNQVEPFEDKLAQEMILALRNNCAEFGVTFFDIGSGNQGIVHVVGPEQGITQPGTTIACGDSHTATH